jgi:hypothetical protein
MVKPSDQQNCTLVVKPIEISNVLGGNGMPQHYGAATVAKLLEPTNTVLRSRDRTMVPRVANRCDEGKSRAKVKRS